MRSASYLVVQIYTGRVLRTFLSDRRLKRRVLLRRRQRKEKGVEKNPLSVTAFSLRCFLGGRGPQTRLARRDVCVLRDEAPKGLGVYRREAGEE